MAPNVNQPRCCIGAWWVAPAVAALVYWAAAVTSLALTTSAHGIAVVWPPSGVLVAALLLAPRAEWARYVALSALASLLANAGAGNPPWLSAGFTAANMTEAVLAAWLLHRWSTDRLSLVNPSCVGCFCLAAGAASLVGASLATLVAAPFVPAFWLSWFTTDLLGMLVVAPMILLVEELSRTGAWLTSRRRSAEAVGWLALVVVTTAGTFAQSDYPLLFLPILALLAAVLRLGRMGAAASVWIIASISATATAFGRGPIQLIDGGQAMQVLFLQFYLLVSFAAALPVAALLAARDRLTARLAESNRLLAMAESMGRVGHWRVDAAKQSLFWSDEVFRIHARTAPDPPSLAQGIDAYHPDDQSTVAAAMQAALATATPFEFIARIVCPDATVRHVLARGEADRGEAGVITGVFGVFQDITRQVAAEQALKLARHEAEEGTRHATTLAETDQLTGLSNRRKSMAALDEAVAKAQAGHGAMAIALFDIDHFKRINDTLGHAAGDRVLRRVARDAQASVPAEMLLGRVGGEEFVVVMPATGAMAAAMVSERIRLAIQAGGSDPQTDPAVSASFGVAQLQAGETSELLLQRADRALYEAKQAGRNTLRQAA